MIAGQSLEIPWDTSVANTTRLSEEGMKLSLQTWKDGKQDGTRFFHGA